MIFALDYDDTFSAAPDLFRGFVRMAHDLGHEVLIVTARYEAGYKQEYGAETPEDWNDDLFDAIEGLNLKVIFCNMKPKKQVCLLSGIHIDVWIDDNPDAIVIRSAYAPKS